MGRSWRSRRWRSSALGFILLFYRGSLLDSAFNQAWLTSLLLLDMVALIYHLWAVADSYLLAGQPPEGQPRRRRQTPSARKWGATLGVAVIVSGTVVAHAGVASLDLQWQQGVQCISDLGCGIRHSRPTRPWASTRAIPRWSSIQADQGVSLRAAARPAPRSAPSEPSTQAICRRSTRRTGPRTGPKDGQFNVLLLGVDFEPGSRLRA